MIITTTPSIDGGKIVEYFGVVFGETISGVNFVKDFSAGLSNFFGGRSNTYEDELIKALKGYGNITLEEYFYIRNKQGI